jgi:ATP dependent DNA ligase domain
MGAIFHDPTACAPRRHAASESRHALVVGDIDSVTDRQGVGDSLGQLLRHHRAPPRVCPDRPSTRRAVGAQASKITPSGRRHGKFSSADAFDLIELDGDDLRRWPFSRRKARLARLLAGRDAGIVLNEHIESDGAVVFAGACRMGLEGIGSKRLDAPYRSGRSRDWIKVKNPDCPAMHRAREGRW